MGHQIKVFICLLQEPFTIRIPDGSLLFVRSVVLFNAYTIRKVIRLVNFLLDISLLINTLVGNQGKDQLALFKRKFFCSLRYLFIRKRDDFYDLAIFSEILNDRPFLFDLLS